VGEYGREGVRVHVHVEEYARVQAYVHNAECVCMYVCMYFCMYVCMSLCVCECV
jgi:hypothetical protein